MGGMKRHWGSLKRKSSDGLVVRMKGALANIILQGKVEGERSRGKPARQWLDNVKEWTGLSSNGV